MAKPFFASPEDVEAAFYEALERGNLEDMMAVWSEDEEIVCVHPGGPRLVGSDAVRNSWQRMFQGGTRLSVHVSSAVVTDSMVLSIHSVIETISMADDPHRAAVVIATNIYHRGPAGWRMLLHHGSPGGNEESGPEEAPKTLH